MRIHTISVESIIAPTSIAILGENVENWRPPIYTYDDSIFIIIVIIFNIILS